MRSDCRSASIPSEPPDDAEWPANFLALQQQFQALEEENADWNVKKALVKKPRRWGKKRALVPPLNTGRLRGAQPGNSNRLKHGKRTRERQLFYALVRTHIRAAHVLVAEAKVSCKRRRSLACDVV